MEDNLQKSLLDTRIDHINEMANKPSNASNNLKNKRNQPGDATIYKSMLQDLSPRLSSNEQSTYLYKNPYLDQNNFDDKMLLDDSNIAANNDSNSFIDINSAYGGDSGLANSMILGD